MRAGELGVALRVLARGTRGHAGECHQAIQRALSSRCQPACWATARLMVPCPNRSAVDGDDGTARRAEQS